MSYTTELELSTDGPISYAERKSAAVRDYNDNRIETLIWKLDFIKALRVRLGEWVAKGDDGKISYWRDSLSMARQDWMRRNASRRANRSV